jgi:2'-5' RNA ligase
VKSRYNIALIPSTKSDQVIHFAKNFSVMADTYLLGEKSLPHVTLCQFMAAEDELLSIWKVVCQSVEQQSIQLVFEKFSCMTGYNSFWVSLLPNHSDLLTNMHNVITNLVKDPIKKISDHYDPHMTLMNSKEVKYENAVKTFSNSYIPIQDTFILALGKSDDFGQLVEVICKVS